MVLGTILYEGIDISYHILKLGYRGVSSVYGWLSGTTVKEMSNEEMVKLIKELQGKIGQLEIEQKSMAEETVVSDGSKRIV